MPKEQSPGEFNGAPDEKSPSGIYDLPVTLTEVSYVCVKYGIF